MHQYIRQAFEILFTEIGKLAPNIIYLGHVKEVYAEKSGTEVNSLEIDLLGKLKRKIAQDSDAIGYMYRKGNKNYISFKTTDEVACGSRCEHLKNKEILISEMTEEGLKTFWSEIYK